MTAAGNRPESVHAKPKPLAVTKHSSYIESRGFIFHSRSNDDKNTTQSRWIKIYSSKILFTSFHLNNQTESGRRILSSCCFCLILIFSRSVRTATLDTSFQLPFELHNHCFQNTYVCFLKVASITWKWQFKSTAFRYEYNRLKYF